MSSEEVQKENIQNKLHLKTSLVQQLKVKEKEYLPPKITFNVEEQPSNMIAIQRPKYKNRKRKSFTVNKYEYLPKECLGQCHQRAKQWVAKIMFFAGTIYFLTFYIFHHF